MIELQNLNVGYGKKQVLFDLSVGISPNRLTAIVGVNGCGKTTLLKSMVGLLPPMSGRVRVDGAELFSMKPDERARRVAYLAQGRATPNMTVEQMVMHGRFAHLRYPRVYTPADCKIANAAMLRMGVLPYAKEPLSALSGGIRQNAYIAMVLAQCSDYILLDEPTTYLDIANRLHLMRTLRALTNEGKGVVAVLHDLTLAMEFADEIIVLDHGRLAAQESPDELFETGILRDVFGVNLMRNRVGRSNAYFFVTDKEI